MARKGPRILPDLTGPVFSAPTVKHTDHLGRKTISAARAAKIVSKSEAPRVIRDDAVRWLKPKGHTKAYAGRSLGLWLQDQQLGGKRH